MNPAKGSFFIERGDIYLLEIGAGHPPDGRGRRAQRAQEAPDGYPAPCPEDTRDDTRCPVPGRLAPRPEAGAPWARRGPAGRPDGREQRKQPVLVIQNDIGNRFCQSVIVVPLLPDLRLKNLLLGVLLSAGGGNGLPRDHVALFSQIMTVDKSLFRKDNFMGRPDTKSLERVDEAIKLSLGLSTIQHLETKQKLLRKWQSFFREKIKLVEKDSYRSKAN